MRSAFVAFCATVTLLFASAAANAAECKLPSTMSAVSCSGSALAVAGASRLIVTNAVDAEPTVKLRTPSASSDGLTLEVDDLAGHRVARSVAASGSVVETVIPNVVNATTWVRRARLRDSSRGTIDYFVVYLGGMFVVPAATEQVTTGGYTASFDGKSDLGGFSFVAAPGTAKLVFTPRPSATLSFNGAVDLVNLQSSDLSATIRPGPGIPPIAARLALSLQRSTPAVTLVGSGTFTQSAAFGTLSIANPSLTLGDVPSIVADVGLQIPGLTALKAKSASLDVSHGLSIICDGSIEFDTNLAPPINVQSGFLAGLSITPMRAATRCAGSTLTQLNVGGMVNLPKWLSGSPNSISSVPIALEIAKGRVGLAPGTTLPLVQAGLSMPAGPLTLQLSTFTLLNDSNGNVQLSLAGSASVPGTTAVMFPAITVPLAGGPATAQCPAPTPGAGLSIVPDCSSGRFDGFKASGTIDIQELKAKITATNFAVGFDGTKITVSGGIGGSNTSKAIFNLAGATVTVPENKMSFTVDDKSAAQISIEQADVEMPNDTIRVFGKNLSLKGGTFNLSSKQLTIKDLQTSGGGLRGFTVESASGIEANFATGSNSMLTIGSLNLALGGSVTDLSQKTVIDESGGVHDDDSGNAAVRIGLEKISLTNGILNVNSATVKPAKQCPASLVPLSSASVVSPALALPTKDEIKKYFYHLGWVDVCLSKDTALSFPKPTKAGVQDWALTLAGQIRLRKLVDDTAMLVPFEGAYRVGTFAVTADFSDAGNLHMGGETVHVGVVRLTLGTELRHIDAEVAIQSHELRDATFYFRHVGVEQRLEPVPQGFRAPKYEWHTHAILDPDLPRTGASIATRYLPALLGFLALKHF